MLNFGGVISNSTDFPDFDNAFYLVPSTSPGTFLPFTQKKGFNTHTHTNGTSSFSFWAAKNFFQRSFSWSVFQNRRENQNPTPRFQVQRSQRSTLMNFRGESDRCEMMRGTYTLADGLFFFTWPNIFQGGKNWAFKENSTYME